MANHPSALKRHRQSLVRNKRNHAAKSRMKTSVKKLLQAIEGRDVEQVRQLMPTITSVIARTASAGVIKKRTAARRISRLTKRANTVLNAPA